MSGVRQSRSRATPSRPWQPNGVVTLLTDFGTEDPYVGIMKGVVLGRAPEAQLVDLTHAVAPQSVNAGALLLRSAVRYFPPGTVHLAVVDPGVGSSRDAIVVATERGCLVGPDNGLLRSAAEELGILTVHRIDNRDLFLHPVSKTFHGRDIFAPVAGFLAAGGQPADVGARVADLCRLDDAALREDGDTVQGTIVHVDHFGNLITNIPAEGIPAGSAVELGGRSLEGFATAYATVDPGAVLAIESSWGTVEIACNGGNAAVELACGIGETVIVRRGSSTT